MEITLTRTAKKTNYTIGKVYVNGVKFCDSLEDTDRGLTSEMNESVIRAKKVYGKTAIPTGRYEVTTEWMNSLKCYALMLHNVKGFTGIFVHNGVNENNTEGCPLVGVNNLVGRLDGNRVYMDSLAARVLAETRQGRKSFITIK